MPAAGIAPWALLVRIPPLPITNVSQNPAFLLRPLFLVGYARTGIFWLVKAGVSGSKPCFWPSLCIPESSMDGCGP